MQTKAEFFSRRGRNGVRLAGLALAAVLLAACTLGAGRKSGPPASAAAAVQPTPPVVAVEPTPPAYSAASPAPAAAPKAPAAGETVLRMLAYFDRIRTMSSSELGQEAARLGAIQAPAEQMQLALVLGQSRQTAEVIRSQDLLTRLLANASADAQALHPLARLLAARLGEQRRFEDLLDKQSQLARDLQRRRLIERAHESAATFSRHGVQINFASGDCPVQVERLGSGGVEDAETCKDRLWSEAKRP